MMEQSVAVQFFRSGRYGNLVRLRHPEPFVWLVETPDGEILSAHETDVQAHVWWRLEEA